MLKNILNKIQNHRLYPLLVFIILIGISIVQYYGLEIAYRRELDNIIMLPLIYQFAGILVVLAVNIAIVFIVKKLKIATLISVAIMTIFAIVNHYVTILHGTPFNILLVKNMGTALNVLSNYDIKIDIQVIGILLLFVVQVIVILIVFGKTELKRKFTIAMLVPVMCLACVFYVTDNSVIPKNAVSWSWSVSIDKYGYTPCFVNDFIKSMSIPPKPENYDETSLKEYVEQYQNTVEGTSTPDIIFILNETFYDLNQITDINADVDYMEYLNTLENAVTGYAVVPNAGGGTNRSEYELLTSNSLATNAGVTPFNDLDINNTNSIITYLKSKGYSTLGAHPYSKQNYRRSTAYPGLGFDYVYFDESFTDTEYYYNRHYVTDESVYKNMLKWYEEMPEGPRFMYMLTIQNHAAYNHDEPEHDIVHTLNDYGEQTEEINEYLTSIYVSASAFETLVNYYKNSNRDVIICMVGDHAPAFAKEYIDEKYSELEGELRIRSTPYVIWSNNIDLSGEYDLTSINYLVPITLKMAGMDLSGYYEYLINLNNDIPVVSGYGSYLTNDGRYYSYDDNTEYKDVLDRYFNLCYANMKNKEFMKEFCN